MLFLLIITVVAVAIVGLATRTNIDTATLQMDLFRNRILYDPAGILYIDEMGNAHPGTIDRSKITQTHLDAAFVYPANYGGARVTIINSETGLNSTAIINEPTHTRIKTNVLAGLSDGGTIETYAYPVLVVDGNERYNGVLVLEIAGPARA